MVYAAPRAARRPVLVLLGVQLAQSLVGFVQFFTDLPIVLVGIHLLGAALVSAAMSWVVLRVHARGSAEPAGGRGGRRPLSGLAAGPAFTHPRAW